MSQYKRKLKIGERWWYKFSFNGKVYFSKTIYLSKTEAKRAESIKYEELSLNERNPSQKPILSLIEAINERLDFFVISATKSDKYYTENCYYFSILLSKYDKNTAIDSITKSDLNKLFIEESEKLNKNGQDNYKVNAMIRVYKALYNHVINGHDLNIKNPLIGIKSLPIQKKLKYIPNDNDIKNVQLICNHQQNLLIDFVKETGARISEALRFKGSDLFDDYIVLYTSKSKDSNVVPRKVPRPLCLKEIRLKHDELLFNQWIEKPKFLSKKVSLLLQRPWNWHNLRHRYASKLSKEGKPLFEIMLLLGHSQIKTTQGYLQLLP